MAIGTEKTADLEKKLAEMGIREEDLIERFVRASGPGGQKVNKTSSAVYLKHVPTGFEVKMQTSRSQTYNRYLARRRLIELIEERVLGEKSAAQQKIEKIRRQKRKRSKRAKNKMLADKLHVAKKKESRRVGKDDG